MYVGTRHTTQTHYIIILYVYVANIIIIVIMKCPFPLLNPIGQSRAGWVTHYSLYEYLLRRSSHKYDRDVSTSKKKKRLD